METARGNKPRRLVEVVDAEPSPTLAAASVGQVGSWLPYSQIMPLGNVGNGFWETILF